MSGWNKDHDFVISCSPAIKMSHLVYFNTKIEITRGFFHREFATSENFQQISMKGNEKLHN